MGDMADDAFDRVIQEEIEEMELRQHYATVLTPDLISSAEFFVSHYKDAPPIVLNIIQYFHNYGKLSDKQRNVLMYFCASRDSYES